MAAADVCYRFITERAGGHHHPGTSDFRCVYTVWASLGSSEFLLDGARPSSSASDSIVHIRYVHVERGGGRGVPCKHHWKHLLCPAAAVCKAAVIRLNNRALSRMQAGAVFAHKAEKEWKCCTAADL